MIDLETATSSQRIYFLEFIEGTYRQDSSLYFSELNKGIPEEDDYVDYEAYLADTNTNFYQTISATLDETTGIDDVISLVNSLSSQEKQSLQPLVSFEEFDSYVVGNRARVGPAVEMNLPQLPEGAVLDKAINNAFGDNLGTFEVLFPAIA